MLVNPATRKKKYKVSTIHELHAMLAQHDKEFPVAKSTLAWSFTLPGAQKPAAWPQPTHTFTNGRAVGYNIRRRTAAVRQPVLAGAEDALDDFEASLRAMRTAGVSCNCSCITALLLAILLEHEHDDLISPHLITAHGASLACLMWCTCQCPHKGSTSTHGA